MFPGGAQLLEFSSADALFGAPPTEGGGSQPLSAGVKMIFQPTLPVAIVRWGFIVTTAVVNSATVLTVTLDWRPLVGSAANTVTGATTQIQGSQGWNASSLPGFFTDLAGGSITTPANVTLAAGKGFFHQINPQTKMPPNDASTNPVPSPDTAFVPGGGQQSLGLTVYPGQEVQMNVATAAGTTAGAALLFFHFYHLAFQGSGSNYENVATGIPASITPIVGDPGIWTRALS